MFSFINYIVFAASLEQEFYDICAKNYDYEEAVTNNLTQEQFQTKVTLTVKNLLSQGADPNWSSKKNNGYTALLWACHNGHVDAARALLAYSANIEACLNNEGWTTIHLACCRKKGDIIKLLIEHNVDIDKRDKKGNLPIDLLKDQNYIAQFHGDIVKLFNVTK